MASGYCYKDFQKYDKKEIMEFVIKRVKRLYLPYVLYNVFLLIMHNFFVEINIYTDNPLFVLNENCCGELMSYYSMNELVIQIVKIFLFMGSEQLAGATWFLRALFSHLFFTFCLKRFFI